MPGLDGHHKDTSGSFAKRLIFRKPPEIREKRTPYRSLGKRGLRSDPKARVTLPTVTPPRPSRLGPVNTNGEKYVTHWGWN